MSAVAAARRFHRYRTGEPAHDIALFGMLLREIGVPVAVTTVLRAAAAAAAVRIEDAADFRAALRCCLTADSCEQAAFDVVFPVYWSSSATELLAVAEESAESAPGPDETTGDGSAADRPGAGGDRRGDAVVQRAAYSRSGRAERALTVSQPDRHRIEALARRVARALGSARSRRTRSGDRGEVVDPRDALRHNLRYGGELLTLRYTRPVRERARLVVLCDVSSSMRPHAALFLTFVHALTTMTRTVESAIFNVQTSFVTDVFRRQSLPGALAWLHRQSVALAGGTRIGHCLHGFSTVLETRGALRNETTALVLSDGWDRGDTVLLDREMRRLRDQVGRLLWLDPHAAAAGYAPQVIGLRTALRYVDDYLDFASVESLAQLANRLENPATTTRGRR